ncbi:hypothetical protein ABTD96_19255, partial [Acinetobacter baumannii]
NELIHGIGWKKEQAIKFHMAKPTCCHEAADPALRPARMPRDFSDGHHLHISKSSVFYVFIRRWRLIMQIRQ